MRLSGTFRYALYAALTLLFVTGAAWLVADQLKVGALDDFWQFAAATLLALHGGAAMVTLLLLGALFPLHVRPSWRSQRNRAMGLIMVAAGGVLIATAYGLYYSGSEGPRLWMSWIHTCIGLALPILVLLHVVTGRHSR